MSSRYLSNAMLVIAAIGVGAANLSHAQSYVSSDAPAQQLLNEAVQLDVGLFVLGTQTKASLNGQGTNNPEYDFNQIFGTGYDTQRFRLDGIWRISNRNHMTFMYFTNGVSRTKTLDREIDWGDAMYDVGATVTSRTRLSVYELGYEFAFIKKQSFELAASIGVHYTKVTIGLDGMATVTPPNGPPMTVNGEAKNASVPAPLPVLGLRMGWAFTDHFMLDAQVQALDLSIDSFNGHWTDAKVGVTYLINKHFGVGIGYDDFSTHLSLTKANFEGQLNLGYRGGLIYLRGAF
jgi:hypothetical protein